MRGEDVELLWYAFWFTKGMILLILLLAAALFSKWLLRHIFGICIERRSRKHAIVPSLGTLPPPPSFHASQFKAIDRILARERSELGKQCD